MGLIPIIVGAVLVWMYMAKLVHRWDCLDDKGNQPSSPQSSIPFMVALTPIWIIGFGMLFPWAVRHIHRPWWAFDAKPRPTVAERIAKAEARSLEVEKEAGLEFDGIFMLPGYRDERSKAVDNSTSIYSSNSTIERNQRIFDHVRHLMQRHDEVACRVHCHKRDLSSLRNAAYKFAEDEGWQVEILPNGPVGMIDCDLRFSKIRTAHEDCVHRLVVGEVVMDAMPTPIRSLTSGR